MEKGIQELVALVESWQTTKHTVFNRHTYNDGQNPESLRKFVEAHNVHSRKLIALLDRNRPEADEFYQSLIELAMQAQTIVVGAKTFIDGQDVSQEGMGIVRGYN